MKPTQCSFPRHKPEPWDGFSLPILHPGCPGEAPGPMVQDCVPQWEFVHHHTTSISHDYSQSLQKRWRQAPTVVLPCPMILPIPPLFHQNEDQQGYQVRLRITESYKESVPHPLSFFHRGVRQEESETLFEWGNSHKYSYRSLGVVLQVQSEPWEGK